MQSTRFWDSMHESYLNWTLESWWKMMQWAGASEDTAMVQTEPKPPRLWNGGGSRLIIGQQMQPVFGVFAINGEIGHIHKSVSGQIWKLAVDQWGSLISLSKLSWIVSLTWTRWMVAWHASSGLTHIDVLIDPLILSRKSSLKMSWGTDTSSRTRLVRFPNHYFWTFMK